VRRGFLIAGLAALVGAAVFFFGSRTPPRGQPPLVRLNPTTLEALRAEFNAAAAETRVLVLFSPT
jgi:hypothetical protein